MKMFMKVELSGKGSLNVSVWSDTDCEGYMEVDNQFTDELLLASIPPGVTKRGGKLLAGHPLAFQVILDSTPPKIQ